MKLSRLFVAMLLASSCGSSPPPEVAVPSAPGVALGPSNPTTSVDLVASVVTPSVDPGGEEVSYAFEWKRDGQVQPGLTSETVLAAETAKGQAWEVRVIPSAGGRVGQVRPARRRSQSRTPRRRSSFGLNRRPRPARRASNWCSLRPTLTGTR